jgi:multiple sugar transport system permease protein
MSETLQHGTSASPAGRRARIRLSERPLVWLLPLAILLFLTYVFPALDVVRYSFTDATLLNPEFAYTGASYRNVTGNPDLPGILWVTFLFVTASVILQLTLGLLVALVLHRGFTRSSASSSFAHGSCPGSPPASSGS